MPTERDPDLPGGSDDPTRANDPVDPTQVHQPVDGTRAEGAAPAAGTSEGDRRFDRLEQEPRRSRPEDDRNRTGWLWALLAAILIGIVLFALLSQGDDGDDTVGTTDDTTDTVVPETSVEDTATADTAPETTAPDTTVEETTTTTAAPDPAEPAPMGAVSTADGTDLLDLVQGDDGDAERLASYAGTDVSGEGVEVLDVVEGQGVWIGTDDQQRIFARTTDAMSVEAGDQISFEGTLEENAAEGSGDAIVLSDDQGAEQLSQQGHHIELSELTPA
jgi:hypothetical protein